MHHRLAAIHQQLRAGRMRQSGDARDRSVGAQHVGHVGDRDQAHPPIVQQPRESLHVQLARIGDRCDAQFDAMRIAQHLPRHDVGVMLHLGDQHRLARLQHAAPIAMGDQVDRLGAVAREHDLLARSGR